VTGATHRATASLEQDDGFTGFCQEIRGRQSRDAAADDDDIGVEVGYVFTWAQAGSRMAVSRSGQQFSEGVATLMERFS